MPSARRGSSARTQGVVLWTETRRLAYFATVKLACAAESYASDSR